jgi:DeoR family transcriptional regulator, suf operon transcriptional repressor
MDSTDAPISPTQRRVLAALKRRGEATADELGEMLEISSSAVRLQLKSLRAAGYVESHQERGQPGRPADHYFATERTEALFAGVNNNLTIEILSHLEDEDPALIDRVFERRRRSRVAQLDGKLTGGTLRDKVAEVTELLDAEGYLTDFDEYAPGRYRINLHSCAIWSVAARYGQACTTELEFLRDLIPEATIERVTHKGSGSHVCAYEISA